MKEKNYFCWFVQRVKNTRGATYAQHTRYLCALLLAFILGIGQMWAQTALADLSFSGITAAPSAYTYSTTSTPSYQASQGPSGKKKSCMLVGNGGNGQTPTITASGPTVSEGKRWMAFCPAEDCNLVIECFGSTSKYFMLYDADHYTAKTNCANTDTHLSIIQGTGAWATWEIEGLKADTWYVLSANGSSTYVSSMTFTAASSTPVCPSGLTISSKDSKVAFNEGDAIELTASLTAGNGDISYQWYKGGTAEGNKLTGKTTNKLQIASCTTADEGSYYCVTSKAGCDDPAVNASAFAITVAADTKCFNMPAITSKPADLASVTVTGGTLTDANAASKAIEFDAKGLKFGGSAARLKVTLSSASIVEDTKITVTYECTSDKGSGIAIYNGDYASKTMDESVSGKGSGSWEHTFTAAEAANYADEFMIDRNGGGGTMIVRAITVEDCGPAVTKHTVTLNYNDGETPAGSLTVVDGNAAVKPADPTRGKYTFLGWFVGDTDNEYVWTTAVTDDITLKAHWQDPWTITFDADGGSAVADVTVKHNTKAEKPDDPTKDDNDFLGWFYGDPAVAFDWDANVTQNYALVAHWQLAVAKYDVEYYDGETKIGTEEQVWATAHPTAAGIETAKPLYTFVGWFTSSALEGDPVALNTVTPVEGLKLYGKWAKAFALDIDFEAFIDAEGTSGDWGAELAAKNYAISSTTNVTLDNQGASKPADKGLKIKNNAGAYLSFNVNAGKLVLVKTGRVNGLEASGDGGANYADLSGAGSSEGASVVNPLYNAAEAEYRIRTKVDGYNIIQSITITDPFTVSFDANGGDEVASLNGTPSVTLPNATKGTESFLGWFDADDNKIGEAGESYTPTANITLHAQWEAVSTDARLSAIAFSSDAGTLVPAFDPEVVNYTYTMPYGTAAVPTIIGATKANPAAQEPVIDVQADAWGETAQVHGVAQSSDTKNYYVQMLRAPKDGVEIIGAVVSSNTDAVVTGLYKGTASVNLKDKKIDKGDYYIYVTLKEGQTFQNGDVLVVDVNTKSGIGTSALEISTGKDNLENGILTSVAVDDYSTGENTIVLASVPSGATSIGLKRSDNLNAKINGLKVYRPMNPVLTAIKFNDTDVEVASTTVAATLPNGTNLGSMTVDPTIWWNGAGTAVAANAWEWDVANTYTVTDKDGDATVYTITLTEDVLKHTVSFNTHGGSDIADVEVEDGQKLTAAPTDPEREDYVFQGWAETEDGAIVDVTSFTISADKEFHAVWAAETGVIKLIGNDGNINTNDFITGVAKTTVTFDEVEHNGAAWSGTQVAISGTNQLGKVVQYNATTNQTKLKIKVYNTNNSAKQVYIHKILEGETTAEVEILEVASKTPVESVYYPFNSDENRSFYITTNSADVKILQVKVVDDGTTTLKRAGQVGYELNLNKGRVLYYANSAVTFEGLTLASGSNYNVISATEFQTTKNLSFSISAPVTLLVTTNSAKYYVSQNAEEKGATATAVTTAGEEEFNLTATGTWYLVPSSTSNVKYTKIAFEAPKCVVPVIGTQPASKIDYTTGNDMTASVVASVTDGGTLKYQWYDAADNSEVSGATEATLTTTTPGTYYVIITNTKEGYQEASVQSDNATLKYRKADDASLIALTYGTEAITLIDGVYEYRVVLPEDASAVPALNATPTMADYGATAMITNATAFEAYEAVSSVLVTAENGTTTQTYTVTFVVKHDYAKAEDVTGNTTWNWDGVASAEVKIVASEHGVVLANYISADNFEKLEGQDGARAYRSNTYPSYQGTYLKFHTTVPGRLTINARYASGADLIVNGKKLADLTGTRANYTTIVFTGDVEITSSTGDYRIYNMKFEELTPDYTRPVTEGRYGTICLPYDGLMGCATLYEVAYKDASKIYFDEVLDGSMTAGTPYIFLPNKGAEELQVIYTDNVAAPAGSAKGLVGFIGANEDAAKEVPVGSYILNNNQYRLVEYAGSAFIQSNRAYINLEDISTKASAPAPNRRRISMGYSGAQVATGIGEVQGDEVQSSKLLINGQLFILRGEKMYDASGRLVK